jgi:hypothetical protein
MIMAENQFLTLSDVYNPLDVQMKVQAINEAKIRNRVNAMKMREEFQKERRRSNWKALSNDPRGVFNPVSGQFSSPTMQQSHGSPSGVTQTAGPMVGPAPTPTPDQAPQQVQQQQVPVQNIQNAPQPSEAISNSDKAAIRGQKKLISMAQSVKSLVDQAKKDPAARARIKKMTDSLDNDPDHQAYIKKAGFDEMKYSMDQETGEGKYILAKNWNKEELEQYADNAPNGQILKPLSKHPGKYMIEFNDDGAVVGFNTYSKEEGEDLSKYTVSQWIDMSLHDPDPEKRQRAKEVLEGLGDFETEKYKQKYSGEATEEDYRFAGEIYNKTGKMPPLGRSSYGRVQVLRWARILNEEKGQNVSQLVSGQAQISALQGSLKNIQKQENMMSSFVRNLDEQNIRIKMAMDAIKRTDARFLNVPWRKFKKEIKGSADEAILDMYLTEISTEVGKLASGSAASIAALPEGARVKWESIHDPNLPLSELYKLLNETLAGAHLRMQSVRDEKTSMLNQLSGTQGQTMPSDQSVPDNNDPLGLR